jgi:hypothetical protein
MKFYQFKKLPVPVKARRIRRTIKIKTLEGTMIGRPGDWLIIGVDGERYPCKDDIFRKTYHPCGPNHCDYCAYGGQVNRPCDLHEQCLFEWKKDPVI